MMLDYTIRPAVPADLNSLWPMVRRAVARMHEEGSEQWGEDYPAREDYAADIARGELIAAVTPEGRVLGVACVNQEEAPAYAGVNWSVPGPAVSIHRMAVDPALQRHGVASALFQRAEELARQAGVQSIRVDTYSKNAKMQALFQKRGFVQRGAIRLHFRAHPFPAFEKVL